MNRWNSMDTAPKDGTHILALIHREGIHDMDDNWMPAFTEVRELWYAPYGAIGMNLPWHAGDPFDSHDGMADCHFGESVPIGWLPMTALPPLPAPLSKRRHAV
jgi:hypothetical protein